MARLDHEHFRQGNPLRTIRNLEIRLKTLERTSLGRGGEGTSTLDHGSLTGLGDDDHNIYAPRNGARDFLAPVGGVDPVDAEDFVTLGYLQSQLGGGELDLGLIAGEGITITPEDNLTIIATNFKEGSGIDLHVGGDGAITVAADLYEGDGILLTSGPGGSIKIATNEVPLADLADYAEGSLIIGGAADWETLAAPGAPGYALISSVSSAVWDSTPTWGDLHTFEAGIAFSGASGANNVTIPDNVAVAIELLDADGIEYLRIVTTDAQPIIWFNPVAAGVDFHVAASGVADAFQVRGSDGRMTVGALGAGVVQSSAGGVLSSAAVPLVDIAGYAEGSLIIGGAADWETLAAPGVLGYALISSVSSAVWDPTPTWSGLHTFGASIAIEGTFVGGTLATSIATGTNAFSWGVNCDAAGNWSVVSGGRDSATSAIYTTIGGGYGHTTSGTYAVVGGGQGNISSGDGATVAGGRGIVISGDFAASPGGRDNDAAGDYAFVAGRRAHSGANAGAFVWGDSTDTDVTAERADQTYFRCAGGFKIDAGNLIELLGGGLVVGKTVVNVAAYDVLVTDYILHVTRTATGACAIDFKTAQMVDGRIYIVKDAGGNASTNNITLTTQGAETFDGEATHVIDGDYDAVIVYSDGTNLFVS